MKALLLIPLLLIGLSVVGQKKIYDIINHDSLEMYWSEITEDTNVVLKSGMVVGLPEFRRSQLAPVNNHMVKLVPVQSEANLVARGLAHLWKEYCKEVVADSVYERDMMIFDYGNGRYLVPKGNCIDPGINPAFKGYTGKWVVKTPYFDQDFMNWILKKAK